MWWHDTTNVIIIEAVQLSVLPLVIQDFPALTIHWKYGVNNISTYGNVWKYSHQQGSIFPHIISITCGNQFLSSSACFRSSPIERSLLSMYAAMYITHAYEILLPHPDDVCIVGIDPWLWWLSFHDNTVSSRAHLQPTQACVLSNLCFR